MLILEGFFGAFTVIFFAVLIGVPMGIIYMAPMLEKTIYIVLVIICISVFVFGIKNKEKKTGKFLIVFSLWSWFSLSAMGFILLGA